MSASSNLCYALIQTSIIFYFGVSKRFLTCLPSSILTPLQSTQKAKMVLKFKLSIVSFKNLNYPDDLRTILSYLQSYSKWPQPNIATFLPPTPPLNPIISDSFYFFNEPVSLVFILYLLYY